MQRYEKYKDSGIDWLGEVPEHWEVKKITHVFKQIGSGTTPTAGSALYYENGIINFLQTGDLNDNYIFSTSKKITEKALLEYSSLKIFPVGSLVIAMYGATIGKLGILKIEAATNQACCVLGECQIDLELKYIFYWFMFAKNQILSMSYGGGQPNISQDLIKSLRVHFPSVGEQIAIVTFLDDKCERIDAAIVLKEQQIEKLKELRQITIHNAVTKGTSNFKGETVPTKYSGIDWIGEIPKHWEVKANRTIFIERSENGDESLPLLSVSIHSAVSKEEIDEDLNIRGRIKIEDKSKYKLVRSNDIVFNMMRAWQGAIGQVSNDGMVSPAYIVAKPIISINSMFVEYLFRTRGYIESMNRVSKGITDFRKRLYWDQFKALNTLLPPISEQEEIVVYLEEQTSKIDKAIAQKRAQIIKLKEYKQSLINEVVTGKIKIIA